MAALGRKNWLFAGSFEGARRAALLYSLVQRCKLADVRPFDSLKDVLLRVATHAVAHPRAHAPHLGRDRRSPRRRLIPPDQPAVRRPRLGRQDGVRRTLTDAAFAEAQAQRQAAAATAAAQAPQVPASVKGAILNSVNASNAPCPKGAPCVGDTRGGNHEEGGIAGLDANDNTVISPAQPGPYSTGGTATTNLIPVNQALNNSMVSLTASWHVHPRRGNWNQFPSRHDQTVAAVERQASPGMVHIVIGARNNREYFYNGDGGYQQMRLRDFMRTP